MSRNSKKHLFSLSLPTVIIIGVFVFGILFIGLVLGYFQGKKNKTIQRVSPQIVKAVKPTPPTATVRVPILVYHYVEYVKDQRDTIRKSLNIVPSVFEKQITTMKEANFNFITAKDLGDYLNGEKQLPERPVILTFDDGYGDFYTDVFPILKKHHVVATEYVVPGFTNKLNYMTTKQLQEICDSGIVEIAAHTIHHAYLPRLNHEQAVQEIVGSKQALEEEYGISVVSFAYPYGGYDDSVAKIAKEAGFTNAVTTKGGIEVNQDNRFTLHRIHPGYRVGNELIRSLL